MARGLPAFSAIDAYCVDFAALQSMGGVERRRRGNQNRLPVGHPGRFAMDTETGQRQPAHSAVGGGHDEELHATRGPSK